jgi:hypothetical protein
MGSNCVVVYRLYKKIKFDKDKSMLARDIGNWKYLVAVLASKIFKRYQREVVSEISILYYYIKHLRLYKASKKNWRVHFLSW